MNEQIRESENRLRQSIWLLRNKPYDMALAHEVANNTVACARRTVERAGKIPLGEVAQQLRARPVEVAIAMLDGAPCSLADAFKPEVSGSIVRLYDDLLTILERAASSRPAGEPPHGLRMFILDPSTEIERNMTEQILDLLTILLGRMDGNFTDRGAAVVAAIVSMSRATWVGMANNSDLAFASAMDEFDSIEVERRMLTEAFGRAFEGGTPKDRVDAARRLLSVVIASSKVSGHHAEQWITTGREMIRDAQAAETTMEQTMNLHRAIPANCIDARDAERFASIVERVKNAVGEFSYVFKKYKDVQLSSLEAVEVYAKAREAMIALYESNVVVMGSLTDDGCVFAAKMLYDMHVNGTSMRVEASGIPTSNG